ncbi:peptidoglycan editing factor PgeF [Biformimicrobium ophioploci]|uniref:Purine nucleoside phosphorylase n=1 Tax=Biformimicrobium ophioploci TaxID=3036711 RepID=A0ABQ6M2J7_9GAMM|nr:peptidoglycan editing factor PgeF [Microbulbifer sp. NKW57]GMG88569.1 peptidoglycan editing factor PgeF [Microbulbifer sp. NKW57]
MTDNTLQPNWPAPASVHALTTLRAGGFSGGAYSSNNMGAHVGDDDEAVARNRAQLRKALALPAEPQWLEQIHSDRLVDAQADGVVRTADASYSAQRDVVCAVMTADCLPVLLCNRAGTEVAAVHAGWRGLADGVLRTAVERFDAKPSELMAWFGPAIGPEAFEVGVDVLEAFFESARSEAHNAAIGKAFVPSPTRPLKFRADIYALARAELADLGVTEIYGGEACTFTEEEKYFSYRRDRETGRMATLIWMG